MTLLCRHETRPSRVVIVGIIGAVMALAPVASAQPDAGNGTEGNLELGLRYYETQQYEKAADAFRQAYVENPKPEVLYALAQALRMAGNCEDAKQAYQAFLRTNPEERKAEAARVNMGRCESAPPPASVEPPADPDPPPQPMPKPVPAEEPSPWYTDTTGGLLTLGGVTGLTLASVFLLSSRSSASSLDNAATYGDYESSLDDANRARKIAIVAGSAGTALCIVGVIRYLTRDPSPTVEVSASVGRDHGGLWWSGSF